ncbi:MAG: hypothetical protein KAH20_06770 [Methylococcales bacterium]|nr:hypothetical protein [Methylococcales bacterium]
MTRGHSISFKKPIAFTVGFLFLFSLSACESKKTPTETAQAFWSAMAKNNVDVAKTYCSSQSQIPPSTSNTLFKESTFSYGKIIIDGNEATVEAQIKPPFNNRSSFTTFLIKENETWKVDCKRSASNLAGNHLVEDFFKSLNELGENLNKQLEKQLPLIEKEVESFGQELEKQINNFENELKKSHPKEQKKTYKDTI